MKKNLTKNDINKDKKNDEIESDINKEKEEIQKLTIDNQQILAKTRENQNNINIYEMNFGQLFFSEETKKEIQDESNKFKADYEKFNFEKQQLFNQYRSDPQLIKFFQLAQTNPFLFQYINPQIYYECWPMIQMQQMQQMPPQMQQMPPQMQQMPPQMPPQIPPQIIPQMQMQPQISQMSQ